MHITTTSAMLHLPLQKLNNTAKHESQMNNVLCTFQVVSILFWVAELLHST